MPTSLHLSNLTTTLDLNDGVAYELRRNEWKPAVAGLRDDATASFGTYADEIESIPINILGLTHDDRTANLQALITMIDEAARFVAGEADEKDNPVTFSMNVNAGAGDSGPTGTALVYGAPAGKDPLTLPRDYLDQAAAGAIEGVIVNFVRRGQWQSFVTTNSAAIADNPAILQANFPDRVPQSSPCSVTITGFDWDFASWLEKGFLVVTNDKEKMYFQQAAAFGASGVFSTPAPAAGEKAKYANLLRYTPAVTTYVAHPSTGLLLPTFSPNLQGRVKLFGVFAAVRSNSVTPSWRVKMRLQNAGGSDFAYGPETYIDSGSTACRIVFLGVCENPFVHSRLNFEIACSATGSSLDIDYFFLVGMDDEFTRVIAIDRTYFDFSADTHAIELHIDNEPSTNLEAQVYLFNTFTLDKVFCSYRGDPNITYKDSLKAATPHLAAVWLSATGSTWTYTNSFTGAKIQLGLSASAHRSFSTPL